MSQLEKNTVSAMGQLGENACVRAVTPENTGRRILFVGNSITLHGVLKDIGWDNEWGMAASALEKDYVHLVTAAVLEKEPDAYCALSQVADWERNYKTGSEHHEPFKAAREFGADVIVLRFVENCPYDGFDADAFYKEYKNLIDYLNPDGKAKLIFTTGFWKHPGDDTIIKVAKEYNSPVEYLGELGEQPEMRADGLFEHTGVAHHPGDKGMQAIADAILKHI